MRVCGIAGIRAFSEGFALDADLVTAMRDTLAHRGPDDGGSWVDPRRRAALGHRRLSIVDLSPAGHNPMPNEDETVWVTFNGEIYNHAALREGLERRGHRYRSRTDTETIVHLYEEHGPACVEHLDGMFALAVWDVRRGELLLARDRLGKKPLYYAQPPGGFVFASEIKALLEHPAITPDLDTDAFHHYLTFVAAPAPLTMFAGIRKLAPAERLVLRADGTAQRDTYWTPFADAARAEVAALDEAGARDRLLELLRDSIARRMMADVPFGVLLSGGVDSSTNVALMSELMDRPVRTFSIGFAEHERYNELEHARTIARRFATDHHEVVVDERDAMDFLPELIHHQDEPIADWTCVPTYYVARLARENGTKVVQVGEGADELLHGYAGYADAVATHRRWWAPFQRVPRAGREAAARAAAAGVRRLGRGDPVARMIAEAAAGRLPWWGGAVCWRGWTRDLILAGADSGPDPYEVVDRLWREAERLHPGADLLQKMTYLELRHRLAELLLMRVDKMTMANSVEARTPFLDRAVVEFALALAPEMKVRDGVGKWLLKTAVDGLLPSEIVWRPKQGFGAPVSEWFRGELGERAQREIRGSSLAERGLLDYDAIDGVWERHRRGDGEWGFNLWVLWNVSAWHDRWVAGREAPHAAGAV